jgi:hypothetical protein
MRAHKWHGINRLPFGGVEDGPGPGLRQYSDVVEALSNSHYTACSYVDQKGPYFSYP